MLKRLLKNRNRDKTPQKPQEPEPSPLIIKLIKGDHVVIKNSDDIKQLESFSEINEMQVHLTPPVRPPANRYGRSKGLVYPYATGDMEMLNQHILRLKPKKLELYLAAINKFSSEAKVNNAVSTLLQNTNGYSLSINGPLRNIVTFSTWSIPAKNDIVFMNKLVKVDESLLFWRDSILRSAKTTSLEIVSNKRGDELYDFIRYWKRVLFEGNLKFLRISKISDNIGLCLRLLGASDSFRVLEILDEEDNEVLLKALMSNSGKFRILLGGSRNPLFYAALKTDSFKKLEFDDLLSFLQSSSNKMYPSHKYIAMKRVCYYHYHDMDSAAVAVSSFGMLNIGFY